MHWTAEQVEDWAEFCQRELPLPSFNPAALKLSGADLCAVTPDFLNTTLGGPKYIGDSLYKCLERLRASKTSGELSLLGLSLCVCVCVCVCLFLCVFVCLCGVHMAT